MARVPRKLPPTADLHPATLEAVKKISPGELEKYELLYTFGPTASAHMRQLPTFELCQLIARAAYWRRGFKIEDYDVTINHADGSIKLMLGSRGQKFEMGFSPETSPREAWRLLLQNLFVAIHYGRICRHRKDYHRQRPKCAQLTGDFIEALFSRPFPFPDIEWAAFHARILNNPPQMVLGKGEDVPACVRFYL